MNSNSSGIFCSARAPEVTVRPSMMTTKNYFFEKKAVKQTNIHRAQSCLGGHQRSQEPGSHSKKQEKWARCSRSGFPFKRAPARRPPTPRSRDRRVHLPCTPGSLRWWHPSQSLGLPGRLLCRYRSCPWSYSAVPAARPLSVEEEDVPPSRRSLLAVHHQSPCWARRQWSRAP